MCFLSSIFFVCKQWYRKKTFSFVGFEHMFKVRGMCFRQGRQTPVPFFFLENDLGCPIPTFETEYPKYKSEIAEEFERSSSREN